ncbi:MAG: hypothetical protein BMS9Abin05_0879 [Rhodothermia bacterium]|nr:MAG: hypothetical protein BMS9Abin05_0879 [Rhodothermia bacterium]
MVSRITGKILSLTKIVRRAQTLAATSATLTLGSMTTLVFLPLDLPARIAMVVSSVLFFCRKIYVYVYARHSTERLEFEERFIALSSDPRHLRESVSSRSKMWNDSAIVRSVRGADYRPNLDVSPFNVLNKKLEKHLKRAFSGIVLPRPWPDHLFLSLWIGTWVYHAILNPNPSVLAATVLVLTGLGIFTVICWLEFGFNIALRDQRIRFHTMFWDLAEWLIDQLSPPQETYSNGSGYTRKEHFRANPWFVAKQK